MCHYMSKSTLQSLPLGHSEASYPWSNLRKKGENECKLTLYFQILNWDLMKEFQSIEREELLSMRIQGKVVYVGWKSKALWEQTFWNLFYNWDGTMFIGRICSSSLGHDLLGLWQGKMLLFSVLMRDNEQIDISAETNSLWAKVGIEGSSLGSWSVCNGALSGSISGRNKRLNMKGLLWHHNLFEIQI